MMQALPTAAAAQDQDRCRFFCQPEIEIAPSGRATGKVVIKVA
jgi:hypothetical protein